MWSAELVSPDRAKGEFLGFAGDGGDDCLDLLLLEWSSSGICEDFTSQALGIPLDQYDADCRASRWIERDDLSK